VLSKYLSGKCLGISVWVCEASVRNRDRVRKCLHVFLELMSVRGSFLSLPTKVVQGAG
jgi:hypothetical protein